MKKLLLLSAMWALAGPSLFAQTVVPSQRDEIIIDAGATGKADPGDRIRYKVSIQNTGGAAADGTQLNIVPDPRSTFVPGSFRSSPLALPDAYACTGNVGISVAAASGLLANDFDDNPGGLSCSAVSNAATTQGGSITIISDGSFSYTPPAGFTGSDTYTYTLNDGNGVGGDVPATDAATVTFTVSNPIWFVDNTGGGAGGAGTLSNPFKTLGDFNSSAGPLAGQLVFIRHTGTNYGGGIVLKNNMTLFGSGHTGGANLANVLPFSLAPNSVALPAINGTRPVITHTGGDGVTLASANTLRGFDLGACGDFGIENSGTNPVGNLVVSEVSINNTTGGGFDASHGSGAGMSVVFTNLSCSGGTNGINLTDCAGTFTVNGGTITNPTGAGVLISGGSVTFSSSGVISVNSGFAVDIDNHDSNNVTFSGNITSTGNGIRVQNCGGGTKTFSGSSKSLNTGANAAVSLNNNTGATLNFTGGGLVISTTSGTGFSATGGGTLTVQGAGNTINSASGSTALNVVNTTIGGSGLTFQSISSNGGSATGIILDNTGSSGGLTVTGTGSAASGGTIANKTGATGSNTTGVGIYLNNCANVSLTRMQLNNFSNFGIRGFTVNNFTMDNCVVNHSSGKNGDDAATDEGSIYFGAENPGGTNGLTGTVSVTNCFIEDGYENNFKIANLSGTLSQLTMTNCTIRDNSSVSPGNNGFEIRAQGTANITADITNSIFTGNRANGIQVSTTSEHTGTVDVEIGVAGVAGSGGTFTNNNIGINIAHGSPGILNFDIHRGTFNSNPGLASPININLAAGGPDGLGVGPMSGSITNNAITNANSGTGPGIRVTTNGTDADGSNVLTILVSNNNISQIGNRGIEMIAGDGNSTLNATITNNAVTLTDPLAADAIRIDTGVTSADLTKICLAISGNTATTIAGSNGIRIRNRFSGTTFRIPGYGGAATDPDGTHDAVISHLSSLNPLTPLITADHQVGNSGFTAGAPCNTPN